MTDTKILLESNSDTADVNCIRYPRMEVDPLSRLGLIAPLNSVPTTHSGGATNREIVKAVQQVNRSQLLGQDRELIYRRDPKTGHMIVQTVNPQNGDVLDQIPLEVLLRLQELATAGAHH